MAQYRVMEPTTFVRNGKVLICQTPGEIIKLEDELAAELGSAVQRVGGAPEQESAPEPPQEPAVEPTADQQAAVANAPAEPEVDKSKRNRGRGGENG